MVRRRRRRRDPPLNEPTGLVAAYSASGPAWAAGPALVYRRLADVLVEQCPGGVRGERVLDLGAGTGSAGAAALAAGAASVVAVDAAVGMLRTGGQVGAVGDALALPFASGTFGAVVAAFSLNHLDDPAAGLREAARVARPGGKVVAGAYAADDRHPARAAVDDAATARGWSPPAWYHWVREEATPKLSTVEGARDALAAAGLEGDAARRRLTLEELGPRDLVEWRLGMAQLAPFVGALTASARAELVADALDRLGTDPPPLVRSIIVLRARTSF